MTDPREPTQKQRVEQMLLAGPVCATTFLANYMSAARSRVAELRAAGWQIESVTCDLGHNHKTRQIMYRHLAGSDCRCPRCRWDWPDTRLLTPERQARRVAGMLADVLFVELLRAFAPAEIVAELDAYLTVERTRWYS